MVTQKIWFWICFSVSPLVPCQDLGKLVHFFSFFFFNVPHPQSLRYIWHITLFKFKIYNVLFGTFIYCKIITSVALTNIFVSLNYHFFPAVRTFRIYSLSNFQVYNAVLTILIMLCVICRELTCLLTGGLYLLTNYLPLPHHPPAHGNHHSTLFLWIWLFYIASISDTNSICFLCLTYLP